MKKHIYYLQGFLTLILIPALFSCSSNQDPQKIIDRAIEFHGGALFEHMRLSFDFRDKHYTAERLAGQFTYTREFEDSTVHIRDILTNEGFTRLVNGDTADLPEKKANAYRNSVNSVIYFALLPFGLNDPAVNKTWIGRMEMDGKSYDKVKVSFDEEGGGEDHEDIFMYWFDREDGSMDFLAYKYFSGEGGTRFRKVIRTRNINGIVLADYHNYGLETTQIDLADIDSLFLEEKLELVSEIDLENITVEILDTDA